MTQENESLIFREEDIAWLAGLLEGEGSFGIDSRAAQRYTNSTAPGNPYISVSMTDEDVIAKVATITGKNYFLVSQKTVTEKKVFKCHIGDRATVFTILTRILPYMGKRRQSEIQPLLAEIASWVE